MLKKCVTTNKQITQDYIEFKCPLCGAKIARSLESRSAGKKYVCKECGFEGP